MSTKMLLVVGCLVSGMLVASQKSGEITLKQNVATAVVAKQFCENPGKHGVEVLIQRPGYQIISGNNLPTLCPCSGKVNAVVITNPQGRVCWNNYKKPIHRVDLTEAGKLRVFLCNGEKHTWSELVVENI